MQSEEPGGTRIQSVPAESSKPNLPSPAPPGYQCVRCHWADVLFGGREIVLFNNVRYRVLLVMIGCIACILGWMGAVAVPHPGLVWSGHRTSWFDWVLSGAPKVLSAVPWSQTLLYPSPFAGVPRFPPSTVCIQAHYPDMPLPLSQPEPRVCCPTVRTQCVHKVSRKMVRSCPEHLPPEKTSMEAPKNLQKHRKKSRKEQALSNTTE